MKSKLKFPGWRFLIRPWALLVCLGLCGCKGDLGNGVPYLEEPIVDLGQVEHGKQVFARFVLRNPTSGPLLIKQIVVSCKCAYLNLQAISADGSRRDALVGPRRGIREKIILEPGEYAEAVFRYETAERPPIAISLSEPVRFLLDHPITKILKGAIKIKIRTRCKCRPDNPRFGQWSVSQRATCRIRLVPLGGAKPIGIIGFRGLTDKFKARVVATSATETSLELTAGPGLSPGKYIFPIIIQTDIDGGYDLPKNLSGVVVNDLQIDPPAPLPLTNLEPDGTLQNNLLIKWHRPGPGLKLVILSSTGTEPDKVSLEEIRKGRVWSLLVKVKRSLPGKFNGEVVVGDHEGICKPVAIPFRGIVRK